MSSIVLGQTDAGKVIKADLQTLLATRLLIQANSGGGKSWVIRRIVEQAFGKVQMILVDPEGEFSTLREKYGFVLAGPGGETPATVRSAGMLATRLLELNASAVCDIYELKPGERHAWVKAFLTSLVNAPKRLWQPVLVIVDEAHVYCPEKGQGESEASDAMTDLASRGRKRMFCGIFATQRLGKLSKNVSSELLNRLVGPTFEDIDVKRAAELLGIPKSDQRAFFQERRIAEPGNFYAIGRAIAKEIVQFRVGEIITSHGVIGAKALKAGPPPTPGSVSKLLPQLADLPKEAEQVARNEAELRAENAELKKRLAQRPKEITEKTVEKRVEVPVLKDSQIVSLTTMCDRLSVALLELAGLVRKATTPRPAVPAPMVIARPQAIPISPVAGVHSTGYAAGVASAANRAEGNGNGAISPGEKKIMVAAGQYGTVDRDQLTTLTGYKRSSRDEYIGRLVRRGYVVAQGKSIALTSEGMRALGSDYEPLPTGSALKDRMLRELPDGESKILAVLTESGEPVAVPRDAIGERIGYKRSSLNEYIGRLMRRRMVEVAGNGFVVASALLFDSKEAS